MEKRNAEIFLASDLPHLVFPQLHKRFVTIYFFKQMTQMPFSTLQQDQLD